MGVRAKHRIRVEAEVSENQILTEALLLMGKYGWTGCTFQKIAEKCHMSQSNVLYHFPSRIELLKALLDRISKTNFAMVSEAIKPEHDALTRIIIHFEKNIEWGKKHPEEALVLMTIYTEACYSHEFSEIFSKVLFRAQNRIREHVLAGIRERTFHPNLEPSALSKILHNVLVGAFINVVAGGLTEPNIYSHKEWEKVIKNLVGFKKV